MVAVAKMKKEEKEECNNKNSSNNGEIKTHQPHRPIDPIDLRFGMDSSSMIMMKTGATTWLFVVICTPGGGKIKTRSPHRLKSNPIDLRFGIDSFHDDDEDWSHYMAVGGTALGGTVGGKAVFDHCAIIRQCRRCPLPWPRRSQHFPPAAGHGCYGGIFLINIRNAAPIFHVGCDRRG